MSLNRRERVLMRPTLALLCWWTFDVRNRTAKSWPIWQLERLAWRICGTRMPRG